MAEQHEDIVEVSSTSVDEGFEDSIFDPLSGYSEIIKDQQSKHVGIRIFGTVVPFHGLFLFRFQTLADAQFIGSAVDAFTEAKMKEKGGRDAISHLAESERASIIREVNDAIGDYQNDLMVKRCTLYPENIEAMIDNNQLPSGVYSLLLSRIMIISGFVDADIREI